ncbi:hypothetical protein [Terasakiella sp.]|uniref:hypothetical protein n=1 Tax=Terasakiella sp. TaxID=2034861 RepID=UPI003AA8CB22
MSNHDTDIPKSYLTAFLVEHSPQVISERLKKNKHIHEACEGDVWSAIGFRGFGQFSQESFLNAARLVLEEQTPQEITSLDEVKCLISTDGDGLSVTRFDEQETTSVWNPDDILLLHPDKAVRHRIFEKLIRKFGPTGLKRDNWQSIIDCRALNNNELTQIFREINTSCNVLFDRARAFMLAGKGAMNELVPDQIEYYQKLVGPCPKHNEDAESYISGSLRRHRISLITEDPVAGFELLSVSYLRHDLALVELFENIDDELILSAIDASFPLKDPFSTLAVLKVATAHAERNKKLKKDASEALQKLLDEEFKSISGQNVYLYMPALILLVENVISTMPVFSNQPAYWRKLCAWSHTGVLVRAMSDLEFDIGSFIKWCAEYPDFAETIKKYNDYRLEPRGPSFPEVTVNLRGEILGRVNLLSEELSKASIATPDGKTAQQFIDNIKDSKAIAAMFQPGPLEGHTEIPKQNALPDEVKDMLMGLKDLESWDPQWNLPLNAVQYFAVENDIIDHFLKMFHCIDVHIENKREEALNTIAIVARIASISRRIDLANAVAEKCFQTAEQSPKVIEGQVLPAILLIAAAANPERTAFGQWLDDQMTRLVQVLPFGETSEYALNFIELLRCVGDLPVGSLARAEAIARLGIR